MFAPAAVPLVGKFPHFEFWRLEGRQVTKHFHLSSTSQRKPRQYREVDSTDEGELTRRRTKCRKILGARFSWVPSHPHRSPRFDSPVWWLIFVAPALLHHVLRSRSHGDPIQMLTPAASRHSSSSVGYFPRAGFHSVTERWRCCSAISGAWKRQCSAVDSQSLQREVSTRCRCPC